MKNFTKIKFTKFLLAILICCIASSAFALSPPPEPTITDLATGEAYRSYVNTMYDYLIKTNINYAIRYKTIALGGKYVTQRSCNNNEPCIFSIGIQNGIPVASFLLVSQSNHSAAKAFAFEQLQRLHQGAIKNVDIYDLGESLTKYFGFYGPEASCKTDDLMAGCTFVTRK